MTLEEQKELSALKAEQAAQKAEIDFFAQGLPFAEVKTCSAKGLFGGKWKNVIKEHLGDEEFAMFVEREGDKEIDFPLAALDMGEAGKWFSKNDKITVFCEGKPIYNGQYKVLDTERPFIFILKGMDGTATGTVINNSRSEGAAKGMKRSTERISNLVGDLPPAEDEKNPEAREPASEDEKKKNRRSTNKWLVVICLLLLIFIIYQLKNKKL